MSYIPAIYSTFFGIGAATIPVPLGAGTSRIRTEPDLPVILDGIVWAFAILFPQ